MRTDLLGDLVPHGEAGLRLVIGSWKIMAISFPADGACRPAHRRELCCSNWTDPPTRRQAAGSSPMMARAETVLPDRSRRPGPSLPPLER